MIAGCDALSICVCRSRPACRRGVTNGWVAQALSGHGFPLPSSRCLIAFVSQTRARSRMHVRRIDDRKTRIRLCRRTLTATQSRSRRNLNATYLSIAHGLSAVLDDGESFAYCPLSARAADRTFVSLTSCAGQTRLHLPASSTTIVRSAMAGTSARLIGSCGRNVVDARGSPRMTAQQPRKRHPSARPKSVRLRAPRRHSASTSAGGGSDVRPALRRSADRRG